jgi:hypothetical protein
MKSPHDVIGEFRHALREYRRADRKFREVANKEPNTRKYLVAKYGLKGYRIQLEKKFDQVVDFGLDKKETLPHIDLYAAYSGWWSHV